jgi:redox-sensitive bicupin YhaK (pirin superfamily)
MLTLRPANERGHADHGWLNSYHSFSFAEYFDPNNMGFSVLRVINEDRVEAGKGFGTHPHRDMEIISIVLEGSLEHQDSLGNRATIRPGEVQRMSAGTGVRHSEYNPSPLVPVHFLQIWIETAKKGSPPGYEQKSFSAEAKQGKLLLVVSPDGRDGSLSVQQDAYLYQSLLAAGDKVEHLLAPSRKAYVHVATGSATLNGQPLGAGDGVRVQEEERLVLETASRAEVLLFDLP